jgi:NAD(P)-dependent dehydrogenase (short-subunit alcohol dehydrogenase family)
MGDSAATFWAGRRVLVTAAGSPLGRDLLAELQARSAAVVALLGRGETLGDSAGRVAVVRGRADDHARLTTALVLHDIQTVFHLAAGGLSAVRSAARLAGGVPVVIPPIASTDLVGDLIWRAEALAPAARRAA